MKQKNIIAQKGAPPNGPPSRRQQRGPPPNVSALYNNSDTNVLPPHTRRHTSYSPSMETTMLKASTGRGVLSPGQVARLKPRGPPPTSPYGMMNTPPSRHAGDVNYPQHQEERGPPGVGNMNINGGRIGPASRGPTPRGPIPKGPSPRGPPPRGPPPQRQPPRNISQGGTPTSFSRMDLPNSGTRTGPEVSSHNQGKNEISHMIFTFTSNKFKHSTLFLFIIDQMSPPAWSNNSQEHQVKTTQQTPKSIGPRTPILNQTIHPKNAPIPTDITQLGPPPSNVKTYAPPFSRNPTKIFGKLVLVLIQGKNLKAGQGTFGRANPLVRVKVGHKEVRTEAHTEGGKNPVSLMVL